MRPEDELLAAQRLMLEDLNRRVSGYHKAILGLLSLLRDTKVPVAKIDQAIKPAFAVMEMERHA